MTGVVVDLADHLVPVDRGHVANAAPSLPRRSHPLHQERGPASACVRGGRPGQRPGLTRVNDA